MTRIRSTLHEDVCTIMTTSLSILLRMKNVSVKSCRENQNTHFVFSNRFFFFFESPAVCEIVWENVVEWDRQQITI